MTKQELYLIGGMIQVTFVTRYPVFAFSRQIKLPF